MIGIVIGSNQLDCYESWLRCRGFDSVVVDESTGVAGIDVVLFCGGPDLGINKDRDHTDICVFNECMANHISILGICRGMQEVSHFLGSSLIEDLGEKNFTHKPNEDKTSRFHDVLLSDGRRIRVNSRHHQAVASKPFECELYGEADDGTIEVLGSKDGKMMLVQCHPEREEMRDSEIETICVDFLKKHTKTDIK